MVQDDAIPRLRANHRAAKDDDFRAERGAAALYAAIGKAANAFSRSPEPFRPDVPMRPAGPLLASPVREFSWSIILAASVWP
jgi:hypothetical protein